MRKNKNSFLLLEALASMIIISIFLVVFINITKQSRDSNSIPSYASNILYKEILRTNCSSSINSKVILGMQLYQNYKVEFDTNLGKNIVVQYFTLKSNKQKNSPSITLKRRCYI